MRSSRHRTSTIDPPVTGNRLRREIIDGPMPPLVFSVDAEDLSKLGNGSSVARWPDRTGKGADADQTVAASRPVLELDSAGRRAVYFAATKYLAAALFGNGGWGQPAGYAQPITVCMLVKLSSGSTSFRCLVGGQTALASTGSLGLGVSATNQFAVMTTGTGAATTIGVAGGPALDDDTWHTLVYLADTARGWIMCDGYWTVGETTQSHGSPGLIKLGIGAFADGTNNAQGMRMRRLDVYNGVLSLPQAQQWSRQMGRKWGDVDV